MGCYSNCNKILTQELLQVPENSVPLHSVISFSVINYVVSMRCPTRVAQLIFFVPVRTVGSIAAKIWTIRKSQLFCVYCIISTKHAAKDLFKPEEMALRSKYPPIF